MSQGRGPSMRTSARRRTAATAAWPGTGLRVGGAVWGASPEGAARWAAGRVVWDMVIVRGSGWEGEDQLASAVAPAREGRRRAGPREGPPGQYSQRWSRRRQRHLQDCRASVLRL